MELKIEYNSKEDMQAKAREVAEANKRDGTKLRMVFSDFSDPNWKHGDPQVGVMTFTDEPEPIAVDPIKEEYAKASPKRKREMELERLGLV